jgi:hypothetical protein
MWFGIEQIHLDILKAIFNVKKADLEAVGTHLCNLWFIVFFSS